jgi:hypothetical protein
MEVLVDAQLADAVHGNIRTQLLMFKGSGRKRIVDVRLVLVVVKVGEVEAYMMAGALEESKVFLKVPLKGVCSADGEVGSEQDHICTYKDA